MLGTVGGTEEPRVVCASRARISGVITGDGQAGNSTERRSFKGSEDFEAIGLTSVAGAGVVSELGIFGLDGVIENEMGFGYFIHLANILSHSLKFLKCMNIPYHQYVKSSQDENVSQIPQASTKKAINSNHRGANENSRGTSTT